MHAKAIPLFIIALINLIFAVIIFHRREGKQYNVYYSLVVFFLFTWSLGLGGLYYFSNPEQLIRFWINVVYLSGSLIPSFFLFFSFVFHTSRQLSLRMELILLLPAALICYLLFFTNLLIETVILPSRVQVLGPWYPFFVIHFVVYMVSAFYVLFQTRKHSTSSITKNQIDYVIYGTIFTAILGSTTNIFMLTMGNFSLNHIGPYFTLIMVGSFMYAMRRYKYQWEHFVSLDKKSGFL